jgi:hypothetical protein
MHGLCGTPSLPGSFTPRPPTPHTLGCHPSSQVGVSAGGWLARLVLGGALYERGVSWRLAPHVHTLVTCGTPHRSLEAYPFGRAAEAWLAELPKGTVPDGVSTSLAYANHVLPDAGSVLPTRIVCVAGAAVCGTPWDWGATSRDLLRGTLSPLNVLDAWFVSASYVANCGQPDVHGDGVCPIETALLPGAESLILPGVWHNAAPGKLWYGSADVVAAWEQLLP